MRLGIVTVDERRESVKKAIIKYENRGWTMVRLKYVNAEGLVTGLERRVRDTHCYNVFFHVKGCEEDDINNRVSWRIERVDKEVHVYISADARSC